MSLRKALRCWEQGTGHGFCWCKAVSQACTLEKQGRTHQVAPPNCTGTFDRCGGGMGTLMQKHKKKNIKSSMYWHYWLVVAGCYCPFFRSAQGHCRRRQLCIITLILRCIKHRVKHGICMVQTPQLLCWRSSRFLARVVYLFTCSIFDLFLQCMVWQCLGCGSLINTSFAGAVCWRFSRFHRIFSLSKTVLLKNLEISGVFLSIAAIQLNRLCLDRTGFWT